MTTQDLLCLEEMERNGGRFFERLAMAARYADPDNLEKIKATWAEPWDRYSRQATSRQLDLLTELENEIKKKENNGNEDGR